MKMKITSGVVFMYRTGGIPATCLSFTMREQVDIDKLQKAVDIAMTRYPYFCCKAVEENGDYYLVDNNLPVIVSNELLPLGGNESNYHLLGVCGKDNNIIFLIHHGLCDGGGIAPFIKTVLYYYCSYYYGKAMNVTDVRLSGSPVSPDETLDPLSLELKSEQSLNEKTEQNPFILPETNISYDRHYRWLLNFDGSRIYDFSHRYGTGISAVIALMMCEAVNNIFPDINNISANIAIDARASVGAENTFMNCIDSIDVVYSEKIKKYDIETKFTVFTGTTMAEKQPSKVISRFLKLKQLNQYLSQYKELDTKRKVMDFTNHLTVNTFLVSYIGRMNLGDVEQYIQKGEVYGVGTNGLIMEVISVNNSVTVSLMQNFDTDRYVKEFVNVCGSYGLTPRVEEIGEFSTPRCPVF